MRPPKESKNDRFHRLAEARVNKIIDMMRLLGNLSSNLNYAYTHDQVEQIFSALQTELIRTKMRFIKAQKTGKHRFSLTEPYDVATTNESENHPTIAICLPDGTYLRAVAHPDDDYPSINLYWDNGINAPSDTICFVEYNPEKPGQQRVCIGAYCSEEEDTTYYRPYMTVERE